MSRRGFSLAEVLLATALAAVARGAAMTLLLAGILSISFMGFAGLGG